MFLSCSLFDLTILGQFGLILFHMVPALVMLEMVVILTLGEGTFPLALGVVVAVPVLIEGSKSSFSMFEQFSSYHNQ